MKWLVDAAIVLFLLFYGVVFVSAVYDPGTGKKLPEKGEWKRILLAVILGFPFIKH